MASTLNPKAGMACGARGRVSTVGTVEVLWGLLQYCGDFETTVGQL